MSTVPALSVVVPTHGRPDYLARALDSILAQRLPGSGARLEIVVVDDNGDNATMAAQTHAIVMSRDVPMDAGDPQAAVLYMANARNLGGAASRNVGIARASAPVVAFLDDDDEWLPGHAAAALAALANEKVDAVYCDSWVVDEARPGQRVLERIAPHAGDVRRQLLSGWCPSSTSLFAIDRAVLSAAAGPSDDATRHESNAAPAGPFDPALASFQDYDCWLTLSLLHGARFAPLAEPGVVRHRHGGSRITTRTDARRAALEQFVAKWQPRLDEQERVLFSSAARRLEAGIVRTEYLAALTGRHPVAALQAAATLLRVSPSWPEAVRSLVRATVRGR